MIYPRRKTTDLIVVHATGTPAGKDMKLRDIDRKHRSEGLNGIGFHYLVTLDGTVLNGRPAECVGAHTQGYNHNSVAVAYVGGAEGDTRTPAQAVALDQLIKALRREHPEARVVGQRDLPNETGRADPFQWVKNSPGFDAQATYGQ
jgi:N-acetylmuramoyl-L-alanine amidase